MDSCTRAHHLNYGGIEFNSCLDVKRVTVVCRNEVAGNINPFSPNDLLVGWLRGPHTL